MQKIVSKYAVAAHLAFLAVSPLFLFPFCTASTIAKTIGWLVFFAFVWMVMEPSRIGKEMLHDARERSVFAIWRDPFFWVSLALVAFLTVRLFNDGIQMAYNAEESTWYLSSRHWEFFPGTVTGKGDVGFAGSCAAILLLTAIRHTLGKGARLSFLLTSSFLAGLAALVAIVAIYCGNNNASRLALARFSSPSFAGTAFGIWSLAALAGVFGAFEAKWNKLAFLFSFAIGGTLAGLFVFAPVSVILLFLVLFVVEFAIALSWAPLAMIRSINIFKAILSVVAGVLLAGVIVVSFAGDKVIALRLEFFDTLEFFPATFEKARELLSSISQKMFFDHPWIGSGVESFPLALGFNMQEADWAIVGTNQTAALNGWWNLLVERGLVGLMPYAIVFLFLLSMFLVRLVFAFGKECFWPGVALFAFSLGAVFAETFVDSSIFRADVVMAVASLAAIGISSLPKLKRKEAEIQ